MTNPLTSEVVTGLGTVVVQNLQRCGEGEMGSSEREGKSDVGDGELHGDDVDADG